MEAVNPRHEESINMINRFFVALSMTKAHLEHQLQSNIHTQATNVDVRS